MADRIAMVLSAKVAACKEAMLDVYRESARRTIEAAQTPVAMGGNMPVRSGFLRASGHASLGGATGGTMGNPNPHGAFAYDDGAVNLVISSAKLSDTITFAYAANYAAFVEAKRRFVGLAAQRWPQIVAQVAREVEDTAKA